MCAIILDVPIFFLFLEEFHLAEKKVAWWVYPEQVAEYRHNRTLRRIGWGFLIFMVVLIGLCAWVVFDAHDVPPSATEDQYRSDVQTEKIWTK